MKLSEVLKLPKPLCEKVSECYVRTQLRPL